MMRAMKFINKAQDDQLVQSLSEEEKATERQLVHESLSNMADAIGDDGTYVLMLQRKLQTNKAALKRDPKNTISAAIQTLKQLLQGTPEEREAARQEIASMPDEAEPLSTEEEAELDAENANLAESLRSEEDGTMNLMDNVDVLAPDSEDNETESEGSLVQTGGNKAV